MTRAPLILGFLLLTLSLTIQNRFYTPCVEGGGGVGVWGVGEKVLDAVILNNDVPIKILVVSVCVIIVCSWLSVKQRDRLSLLHTRPSHEHSLSLGSRQ